MKPKNERNAGRKKTRKDDEYEKIGPFELKKPYSKYWRSICKKNGNSQAEQIRQLICESIEDCLTKCRLTLKKVYYKGSPLEVSSIDTEAKTACLSHPESGKLLPEVPWVEIDLVDESPDGKTNP